MSSTTTSPFPIIMNSRGKVVDESVRDMLSCKVHIPLVFLQWHSGNWALCLAREGSFWVERRCHSIGRWRRRQRHQHNMFQRATKGQSAKRLNSPMYLPWEKLNHTFDLILTTSQVRWIGDDAVVAVGWRSRCGDEGQRIHTFSPCREWI